MLYKENNIKKYTEQISLIEKLTEQINFMKAIFDSLKHPFYVINTDDYSIEFANKCALKRNHKENKNLEDEKITCYELIHNNQTPCKEEQYPCLVKKVMETGVPYTIEKEYYDMGGNIRGFEVHAYPIFNREGNITKIIKYELDITTRKQTEKALIDSGVEARKLLIAIEQSASTIVITDYKGNIEYVNPKFTLTTGYTFEEVKGKNPRILKSGEVPQKIYEKLWDTISSGEDWRGEFKNRKKNGEMYWELATISPVINKNGQITHYVAVKEDITEKKNAEEALNYRKKIQDIISEISSRFIKTKNESICEKVNNALKVVGDFFNADQSYIFMFCEDDEVIKNTYGWCKHNKKYRFCEDEVIGFNALPWLISEIRQREVIHIKDTNQLFPDAEKQALLNQGIQSLVGVPMINEGEIEGFFCLCFDRIIDEFDETQYFLLKTIGELTAGIISKQRTAKKLEENERKFRSYIDNAPDAIMVMNEKGHYIQVNKAAINISNYSEDELLKMTIFDLFSNNEKEKKKSINSFNKLKEDSKVQGDVLLKRKDGLEVWTTIDAVKLSDTRYLVFHKDISERKKIEEDLKMAKEAAEAANKAKSEFLANMSHEIRTPMNAVLGMTYLALKTELSPKQKEYLQNVERSANLLLTIINDILDFSKIEANKVELEEVNFDIDEVIENVTSMILPHAQKKNLEFLVSVDKDVPKLLVGDPLRLTQILTNLLNNAVKFTEKGKTQLTVKAANDNIEFINDGEYIKLLFSVEDTGIGMTNEQMEKLFKPFSQVDESMTRRFGGTGLGLSICKHLTEMMGGKINVESELGKGSVFSFELNLRKSKNINNNIKRYLPKTKNKEFSQLAGVKVLLVEDNITNQKVIKEILEGWSMKVNVASNGKEALELIRAETFDAVLMDIHMPEMNGYEAAKLIRQKYKILNIPIISMTANTFMNNYEKSYKVGMNDHIIKPIDPDVLYDSLVRWIKHFKYNDNKNSSGKGLQENLQENLVHSAERINRIIKALKTRNPKRSMNELSQLKSLSCSTIFSEELSKLSLLISEYEFKEALLLVENIKDKVNEQKIINECNECEEI